MCHLADANTIGKFYHLLMKNTHERDEQQEGCEA
jgi:hypothetical protein